METLKISIITINRNNAEGLRKTMESVLSQTYRDFEYIIVDGASTDGSVEVIKSMVPEQNMNINGIHVQWLSEQDTGIYNAMNKGIHLSRGEYSLMLNSGDYLVNDNVVATILPELIEIDIIQGNVVIDKNRKPLTCRGYGSSNISFLEVYDGQFLHQASFCRRDLFDRFGYFDESYKYVSDTIFFIKTLGYGGATFRYIDENIAYFDMTGFSNSKDPKVINQHRLEEHSLQQTMFPGRLNDFCKESKPKVALYDILHRHRLLWKVTMLLKIIAERLER